MMFIENRQGILINVSFMDKISIHNKTIYATSDYNNTVYTIDVFETKQEAQDALERLKIKLRKYQMLVTIK